MTLVWTLLTIAIPLLLVAIYCIGRPIGHGFMLATGAYLYFVLPFFAYATHAYWGGPGADLWERAFESAYPMGPAVLVALAVAALAVAAGSGAAKFIRPPRFAAIAVPVRLGLLAFALLTLAWLVYLFNARELLLAGYLLGYFPELMGPLANVNLIATLLLLNFIEHGQSKRLQMAFGLLILCNSAALLSMGGRLYVAAPIVALTLRYLATAQGSRPPRRALVLLLTVGAALLLAAVGLWRLEKDLQLDTLAIGVLAEPLLTSTSFATLFDCNNLQAFAFPTNFLSSFVNFVPSVLLPGKEALLADLDPSFNCLASPFGATHLGTALVINFGVVGSLIAAGLFGFVLQLLRGRSPGNWVYFYACSLLPFMLYRDGFLIFNKSFVANGILLPIILMLAGRLTWFQGGRRRPSTPMQLMPP